MIDWSLARQIAGMAAGTEPAGHLSADLGALAERAEQSVSGYTGLVAREPMPAPEAVDRRAWADANLETMSGLLGPVMDRLGEGMGAGPLGGVMRVAAGATVAAEVGLVTGYLSQRVLGQYELSLVQPDGPVRLLFVAPNLRKTSDELPVDAASFLEWVVLHEVTHVLQFSGVPWLRGHLGVLLSDYLATVQVQLSGGVRRGLPAVPDPRKLLERFREGGLAALVQSPEQRELMERVQAAMAVVEGYAEHTMDVVGAEVLPAYDGLRAAMERRRQDRSAPEKVLQRLLGLDAKMRQYEQGKRFCDAVVDRHGLERLNRVWSAPSALPTLEEIEDPDAWARRAAFEGGPPAIVRGA
jgi:coenzyme F420 biosynthesis associated uncharacterized protein